MIRSVGRLFYAGNICVGDFYFYSIYMCVVSYLCIFSIVFFPRFTLSTVGNLFYSEFHFHFVILFWEFPNNTLVTLSLSLNLLIKTSFDLWLPF